MKESMQKKVGRVRPPRVEITYDVEIGEAIEKKELPFVMGILADLSGHSEKAKSLKQRKFVELDPSNFNEIMKAIAPTVRGKVEDKIGGKKEGLALNLKFESMDDFGPNAIVEMVPELKAVYEQRTKLRDLVTKLDGNEALALMMQEIMKDKEKLKKLKAELDDFFKGSEKKAEKEKEKEE